VIYVFNLLKKYPPRKSEIEDLNCKTDKCSFLCYKEREVSYEMRVFISRFDHIGLVYKYREFAELSNDAVFVDVDRAKIEAKRP